MFVESHAMCITLNLIGSKDIANALNDSMYARTYISAISKLNRLWDKTNYSKSSEIITNTLKSSLSRPNVTRWNAVHSSVSEVLSKDHQQMDALMLKFDIPSFTTQDRHFLNEYIKV